MLILLKTKHFLPDSRNIYLKETGLPSILPNPLFAGDGSDILKYIFAAFVVPKS